MTRTARFCSIALMTTCIGCPGSLSDPDRFLSMESEAGTALETGSQCPDVPSVVFAQNCTSPSCHNSTDKAFGLDLQSPGVASRLLSVHATEGPGLLIDPATPSDSVIYTKVTPTPPFGQRMPYGRMPLDDTTIGCLLTWVSSVSSAPEGGDTGDTGYPLGAFDATLGDAGSPGTPDGDAMSDGGNEDGTADGSDDGASMADGE